MRYGHFAAGQFLSAVGEICWGDGDDDAPSGEGFRLRSVRLLDADNQVRSTFEAASSIKVELAYALSQELRGLRLIMLFSMHEGTLLFASTDHVISSEDECYNAGEYVTTCTIPGGLLNEGSYRLSFRAGIPGVREVMPASEVLNVSVVGSGLHGSAFSEKWPGLIAPKLEWSKGQL